MELVDKHWIFAEKNLHQIIQVGFHIDMACFWQRVAILAMLLLKHIRKSSAFVSKEKVPFVQDGKILM